MDINQGLFYQEVLKRLKKYGKNEIDQEEGFSKIKILLNQFKSPLIYILIFAGTVSLFLKEWSDAVVIFLAVGMNSLLGFFQEYKAEKSLLALKKLVVVHAWVLREGKEQLVEATQLVPGDIVLLKNGNKVPADGILLEAVDLYLNEAILTGESMPVAKRAVRGKNLEKPENKNLVFMGTVVVGGRGKMLVTATAKNTKLGKIAKKLNQTKKEDTPLKKQITTFSKNLSIILVVICLLIFTEGLWRRKNLFEVFTLSVAVAVAAVPESLVISLTIILSLGMQRILKRKGLVRKLLAAETLGGVNIICADKTGTLTEGKMKIVKVAGNKERIIEGALWCNNKTNPMEMAMFSWAKEMVSSKKENLLTKYQRVAEIPFSSERKFIAVLLKKSGAEKEGTIFLSGAPEMIVKMSHLRKKEALIWQKKLDKETQKGLRATAFAIKEGKIEDLKTFFQSLKNNFKKYDGYCSDNTEQKTGFKFAGFLFFEDPVRQEVKNSFNLCRQAGIAVKVITGDYRQTAKAVLNKLEIKIKEEEILEGWQLEKMTEEELLKKIDKIILFCRTTPEQKIKIVAAFQKMGYSVAMMGDGVNDALALKKADIGIVVNEASEVAKETADLILLDSNFATIVAAIEEGRVIFENIRKVILYLLSKSFTEIILIGGALLLNLPLPLTAAQILWVNLIQDSFPSVGLAFEPKEEGLMKEKARDKKEPLINHQMKVLIFIIGILNDFILLSVFFILYHLKFDFMIIQTTIFAILGINSLFYALCCKSLRQNLWQLKLANNKFLLGGIFFGLAVMLVSLYFRPAQIFLKTTTPHFLVILLILGISWLNVFLVEGTKWLFLKRKKFVNI